MPARVLRLTMQIYPRLVCTSGDFEKHQCPRGYYDAMYATVSASSTGVRSLRSTNAREGITTLEQRAKSIRLTIRFEKHQCPRGYYDLALEAGGYRQRDAFEKHQCPRGYYDLGTSSSRATPPRARPLRSTNAREGITTTEPASPVRSSRGGRFEKHQCPRGYYDTTATARYCPGRGQVFEKHQCPRGYYDQGRVSYEPVPPRRSFEKHQCPRGYYDARRRAGCPGRTGQ